MSSIYALLLALNRQQPQFFICTMKPFRFLGFSYLIFLGVIVSTPRLALRDRHLADEFGWEEMVSTVAGVYNSLPPEQRANTAILGGNYGEAGAIDLGWELKGAQHCCGSVEVGPRNAPYFGMGWEQYDILACRDFKMPLSQAWPKLKVWN